MAMTSPIATRRRMLAVIGGAAAAGALASTGTAAAHALTATGGDAEIIDAWNRRTAAYGAYNALPAHNFEDPREEEFLAIIDRAEEAINSAVAKTPEGIEIQMWTAFHHIIPVETVDREACLRRDLAHFEAKHRDLDWEVGLLVSAIRSVRRLGGA